MQKYTTKDGKCEKDIHIYLNMVIANWSHVLDKLQQDRKYSLIFLNGCRQDGTPFCFQDVYCWMIKVEVGQGAKRLRLTQHLAAAIIAVV